MNICYINLNRASEHFNFIVNIKMPQFYNTVHYFITNYKFPKSSGTFMTTKGTKHTFHYDSRLFLKLKQLYQEGSFYILHIIVTQQKCQYTYFTE